MDVALPLIACAVLGYLCGSIPFGLLIARWVAGVDIRQHGSHNIGATNVGRVVGRGWGLGAFVLDVGKGVVPVAVLAMAVERMLGVPESVVDYLPLLAGLGAILGHAFPMWIGFRGGKAVATGLGVALGLAPPAAGIGFGVWLLTVAITRYVSLGSMAGATAFAVAAIAMSADPFQAHALPRTIFYAAICVLVVARHRANIGRLVRGEENRMGRSRHAPPHSPPPTSV